MVDPIHGNQVFSASHMGEMHAVPGDDKYVLATAEVPVWFEPEYLDSAWDRVSGEYARWIFDEFTSPSVLKQATGSLFDALFQTRSPPDTLDEIQLVSNPRTTYLITRGVSFARKVSRMVNELRRTGFAGHVKSRQVGSGIWSRDGLRRPGTKIQFAEHEMEAYLGASLLPLNIRRTYTHYHILLAVASKYAAEKWAVAGDPGMRYTHADWMANASVEAGSYGGLNRSNIGTSTVIDVESILPTLYQYMCLPLSEAWPYLTLDPTQMMSAEGRDLLGAILGRNIALFLAATEAGGATQQIEYHNVGKGNQWVVEKAVPYYIRGPMDIGGSASLFLQPPVNTHLFKEGVLVPCSMNDGAADRWVPQAPEIMPFSDVIVDRGELPLDTITATGQQFLRTIVTRDGRVGLRKEKFENWIVAQYPITGYQGNRSLVVDFNLSYLASPIQKPKYVVLADPSTLMAKIAFVQGIMGQTASLGESPPREKPGTLALPGELQRGEPKDLGQVPRPPETAKPEGSEPVKGSTNNNSPMGTPLTEGK
jgi:hypothetical protein